MRTMKSAAKFALAVAWTSAALLGYSSTPALAAFTPTSNNITFVGAGPRWFAPSTITGRGILDRHIKQIFLINASGEVPRPNRSPRLDRTKINSNFQTVVNGTFFGTRARKAVPLGSVIRNWRFESEGVPISRNRGAVVVFNRTTIAVARANAVTMSEIQFEFGPHVSDFMAGGVLLIEDGRKLYRNDIETIQGVPSGVCRPAQHTLIGIRQGRAYAIFNPNSDSKTFLSCAQYRDLLWNHGFRALVKFDGGSGFFYKDSAGHAGRGSWNPTGFLIYE